MHISEFDNFRTTPLMKFTFTANFITIFGAFASLFLAATNSNSEQNYLDGNETLAWIFGGLSILLLLLFISGVIFHQHLDSNASERKRQEADRVSAAKRLNAKYGVAVPYSSIVKLKRAYVNNDRQPVVAHLARFDSVKVDGNPGSYALRMNDSGNLGVFSTLGVEWVPVPVVV